MHVLTFDIYRRGQMKTSYDHTNSFLLKKRQFCLSCVALVCLISYFIKVKHQTLSHQDQMMPYHDMNIPFNYHFSQQRHRHHPIIPFMCLTSSTLHL